MATALTRFILNIPVKLYQNNSSNLRAIHTSSTCYAARKGTREKARARKVKVEVSKVGFIPHNQRGKNRQTKVIVDKHHDDSHKIVCTDNVFPMRYFRWPVYTAEEAVNAHKETHHSTMYNVPDAYVIAHVELNMEAVKKNRFIESFQKIALLPHVFPRDDQRTVLAFCKTQEIQKAVIDAGAALVGGNEIIKKIQDGDIKMADYDYVVAHPNIITDLVPIRGLMKKKFPNLTMGTLGSDLPALVKKFANGIPFRAVKDEHQNNFGSLEVQIGRLNMESKQVAENLEALLKEIDSGRPKREGLFITRCHLYSPPSPETLIINPFVYVSRSLSLQNENDSDDEDTAPAAAVSA